MLAGRDPDSGEGVVAVDQAGPSAVDGRPPSVADQGVGHHQVATPLGVDLNGDPLGESLTRSTWARRPPRLASASSISTVSSGMPG